MENTISLGILVVTASGLVMGTSAWPLKLMRHFRYEHFGFVSMLFSLIVLPWAITLTTCPDVFDAYRSVSPVILWKANAFSFCWGAAQVLAMLCFLRIGVSLTYGILCSLGAAVGVALPLLFKASGAFANAPDLFSRTGLAVMVGVAVMIVGVGFASLAGFGRQRALQGGAESGPNAKGGFAVGLMMVIAAGILSTGWGFAFSYAQAPIIEAVKAKGAPDFYAGISVWAVALLGAGLVNVAYPAWLMTKNRSWGVLAKHPGDLALSLVYGLLFFIPSALLGKGMLLLGVLGASVGWGLVQGTVILGGQMLGLASGEWRGVHGRSRMQLYTAIVILIAAMAIFAFANSLAHGG